MNRWITLGVLLVLGPLFYAHPVQAFCGFYVAKADAKLFNKSSQVVLARDGNRTVLTMANDYQGDLKEFAIVVPVPTFLERDQIHVGDPNLIAHIDAYTAPRLVEYFDRDPCQRAVFRMLALSSRSAVDASESLDGRRENSLGVTIEAEYTIGEYDILILSAKESRGLETWLRQEGYRIPAGASRVLRSYIRQGLRFFVAKVNLEEQSKLGFTHLRPLQMAFESPRFMLPIRLGTLNADGPQELYVYTLTRRGRVETTNYRTVKLPTGSELPVYVKDEFPEFYRAMFARQVERERMRTVFLEYAWAMNLCDPCSADPMSADELRELGVFWIGSEGNGNGKAPVIRRVPEVFVTRLHLRYDGEHFPEDLMLQQTSDRTSYQGRYVLRHPWKGESTCQQARDYFMSLRKRQEREAQTLASLTGWAIGGIRSQIQFAVVEPVKRNWWQKLWKN